MVQWRQLLVTTAAISLLVAASNSHAAITELLSVTSSGNPVSATSASNIQVSDDGRFVLFTSITPNIVPGISPIYGHIFIHDKQTGTNELVSADASGTPLPEGIGGISFEPYLRAMSSDGRYVLMTGSSNNILYVKDRSSGELKRVDFDNIEDMFATGTGSISADGQTVVFTKNSRAQIGIDNMGRPKYSFWVDMYLYKVATGDITAITNDINPGNLNKFSQHSLSADGRYVSFRSELPLTADSFSGYHIYLYDTVTKSIERVDTNANECVTSSIDGVTACDFSDFPTISNDSRFVSYQKYKIGIDPSGYLMNAPQFFIADRTAKTVTRTDIPGLDFLTSGGTQSNPVISADGSYVAFNQFTGRINEVGDGITDFFVYERSTGNIARMNRSTSGDASNDPVFGYSISADASIAAFSTTAINLVPAVTTNDAAVIYTRNSVREGFPFTFAVTKAEYDATTQKVNIEATSTKGASAGMEVPFVGSMAWDSPKGVWTYTMDASVKPSSVIVGNIEGYKTVPVVTPLIDKAPPVIVSSLPAPNTTGVLTSSSATVSFNEPISKGSKFTSITLKKGNTAVKIITSISGNKLTIKPASALSKNSIYTITMPAQAIKDSAGNQLSAPYSMTFKTGSR
jgi:hypothetical protein